MLCNQPHREKEKKYTDIHQLRCRLIKRSLYMKRFPKIFLVTLRLVMKIKTYVTEQNPPPKIPPNVWCFTWQNIRCFAKNSLEILNTSKHKNIRISVNRKCELMIKNLLMPGPTIEPTFSLKLFSLRSSHESL